jgi:hypothetical protein
VGCLWQNSPHAFCALRPCCCRTIHYIGSTIWHSCHSHIRCHILGHIIDTSQVHTGSKLIEPNVARATSPCAAFPLHTYWYHFRTGRLLCGKICLLIFTLHTVHMYLYTRVCLSHNTGTHRLFCYQATACSRHWEFNRVPCYTSRSTHRLLSFSSRNAMLPAWLAAGVAPPPAEASGADARVAAMAPGAPGRPEVPGDEGVISDPEKINKPGNVFLQTTALSRSTIPHSPGDSSSRFPSPSLGMSGTCICVCTPSPAGLPTWCRCVGRSHQQALSCTNGGVCGSTTTCCNRWGL